MLKLNPGEAIFPTIKDNHDGYAYTLKLTRNNETLAKNLGNFDNIVELVTQYLNSYFEKNNIPILIFDLKLSEHSIGVKKIISANSHNQKIENIYGNSFELAAAVALISYLINEPVSSDFAFSGALEFRNDEIYIKEVGELEEKEKILREEYPNLKKFYSAKNTETFTKLINEVFGDGFNDKIKEAVLNNDSIQIIRYSIENDAEIYLNNKRTNATILKFSHGNISEYKLKQLYHFLSRIDINKINKAVIIDGLYPVFAMGMLAPLFNNKINKFLAVRYPHASVPDKLKKEFNFFAIIIYKSKSYTQAEIGDVIYFN